MPDDNGNENANLARRIEELEALLAEQRVNTDNGEMPQHRAANIPVLDDVITPEDYPETEMPRQPASGDKIAELAERLEQKFSKELDETLSILKENLRVNIVEELHTQLQQAKGRNSKGEADTGEG